MLTPKVTEITRGTCHKILKIIKVPGTNRSIR